MLGKRGEIGTMLGRVASLTPAQNSTLDALSKAIKPLTVAEIAEKQQLHHNSVRETIDALMEFGLVQRTRRAPNGRGRPSWTYEAVVPASMDTVSNQLKYLSWAVAKQFEFFGEDAQEQARALGAEWAKQVLQGARIPDHSHHDHVAEAHRLHVHTHKVRIFLSSLGYAAVPDDEDECAFQLLNCPLLAKRYEPGAGEQEKVAGALYEGLIDRLLLITSGGLVWAKYSTGTRPGTCRIALSSRV
ncbi:MAG: hypothetical protein Q4P06_04430 [Actinomycetaceae bacterium]|nr:hypothetical protein [Actinomycetaceae bacterium]